MSETVGKFVVLRHLGNKGSSGNVVAVKDPSTLCVYAVKSIISKSVNLKELVVMFNKNFVNPFLLRYYCLLVEDEITRIVMECYDEDLEQYVKSSKSDIDEAELLKIFGQVVMGASVLEKNKIANGNIRPSNLLLNNHKEVKFANFGEENPADAMSNNEPPSAASHIFAVGCTMYFVATKRYPFDASSLWGKLVGGAFPPIERKDISAGVKELIQQLIDKNPSKRPTIDALLAHPVLQATIASLPPRASVPPAPHLLDSATVASTGAAGAAAAAAAPVDERVKGLEKALLQRNREMSHLSRRIDAIIFEEMQLKWDTDGEEKRDEGREGKEKKKDGDEEKEAEDQEGRDASVRLNKLREILSARDAKRAEQFQQLRRLKKDLDESSKEVARLEKELETEREKTRGNERVVQDLKEKLNQRDRERKEMFKKLKGASPKRTKSTDSDSDND